MHNSIANALKRCLMVGLVCLLTAASLFAYAETDTEMQSPIPLEVAASTDIKIKTQIERIFAELEKLDEVQVTVASGVVKLAGAVANESAAESAMNIARRMNGVIALEDSMVRTLDVQDNLRPAIDGTAKEIMRGVRALPLVLTALAVMALVGFGAHLLASWSSLWSRVAPNRFLSQLLAQAVRVTGIVLGLVLALNLLGASALMGTILGSAGVIGLAISFGVKDSIENYISSIMLSIRQPFRAHDHVVINEFEGIVMRLTTRSTVLMTLDGNHLRIPNATVYKSPILNYTRNPQRRFDFVLGIDADDDPADAMRVGLASISELEWILHDPDPHAVVDSVGDSNILVKFYGWIDQKHTDFGKARSLSIRAAKNALEAQGFSLPEPIYRVRFDGGESIQIKQSEVADSASSPQHVNPIDPASNRKTPKAADTTPDVTGSNDDVEPETHVALQVEEERQENTEEDLLDSSRPVE